MAARGWVRGKQAVAVPRIQFQLWKMEKSRDLLYDFVLVVDSTALDT